MQPPYDPLPPADSGFGGMGPDPAERFGGSQARFQPERTAPTREQQMLVQGINKGGLVDKPKVKKVVKGLKKASKSHAKQAATLEDALKASKKKKSK